MKKILNHTRYFIALLLALTVMSAGNLHAQTCNQVEIKYSEPDCYKKDKQDGGATLPGNGRGCKEVSACVKQNYNYAATVSGTGWSFNWTATGPSAVVFSPNNTSQSVNINWSVAGDYTLTLTATDGSGNVYTYCLLVHVKDKPVANFTFGPNNVCAGSIISFTDASTYSGSYMCNWDFGDPASLGNNYTTSSALASVTHQYNTAGTYTVTMIAYSFTTVSGGPNGDSSVSIKTCCADTVRKQVTIKPGSMHIECVSTVCANDKVTYTAVGCANPTWLTPVGGTILSQSGNTVTIQWGNGSPQGQILASCPGGCTASVPVPILPTNPVIVGNTSPCITSITSYTLPTLPGCTYTWTLTNTTNNTNQNVLLNSYPDNNTVWINWGAAPAGNYQLSVTINNPHKCCSSSGSINISPKDKWKVFMDQTICQGTAASLSINQVSGSYNWTVLPPNTGVSPLTGGPGTSFNPTFTNTGTYTVEVYETANMFCNSGVTNAQQVKIKVVGTPPAGAISGPATVCTGTPYTYTVPPAPPGYFYSWTITGGAGTFQPGNLTSATGNNVSIVWTSLSGIISVVLQRAEPPACPSAPSFYNVSAATVGTVSGPVNVCVDGTGVYTLTGGNLPSGEPITWSISPSGNGTIISGQGTGSVTILWHGQSGAGPWGPVVVSATTNCGAAIPQGGIMIYSKFAVTITKTGTDICSPGGVTLTVNGVPPLGTISWSPGGQTSSSINVTTAGTYTVTVTRGGCTSTATYTVPDPFAILPVTCGVGYCNGITTNEQLGVQVIKPGAGTFTYEWHSGTCASPGPILSTVTNTNLSNNYTATAPGNYCVIVKYGNCQRCVNFTVKKVCCPDVNHPAITFTRNSCNQYVFTGTTPNPTGASITWDFGDGTTQPGTAGVPVTHTYLHAGVYCVTFCVGPPTPNPTSCTGNCAVQTVTVPIEAAFSYTLGCNGCLTVNNLSTVITSSPSYVTYLWNYGDGNTSTSANPPQHCYSTAGNYTVTLTITYNDGQVSCTSTATQNVNYVPLAINITSPVCTGSPATFNLQGSPSFTITSAAWNFGDGFTAYTIPTTHIYNTPGIYNVTLTITDALGNTCSATAKDTVKPGISNCTILPAYICPGGSATLSSTNIGSFTYLWQVETSPNVFINAPGANTGSTYTTTVPGFYRVIVTNSNGCSCTSNKVEVKAVTKPKAIIAASPGTKLCGPGTVILTSPNNLPGYTSDWYVGAPVGVPVYSGPMYYIPFVSSTTNYSLVLTNEYGCKDTCMITITVNPIPAQPVIVSNPSGTLCEGIPIQLTVTNYTGNISWSTGSTGTSITVTAAGVYTATYTDPITGCSSSKNIKVNSRPSTALFPHFCDSIPCRCIRPFTIYAPQPLLVNGAPSGNYSIQWYNPTFSGVTGPVFNNAVTGTYHVIITDLATGCKDTSDNYSIVVPPCDTCDCKGSSWGPIILNEGEAHPVDAKAAVIGAPPQKLECKGSYELICKKTYNLSAIFNCKDTSCPGKVTYSLQPPTGAPITGTLPPLNFTPTVSGVYTLTLYGWCGNKICDSCKIIFKVKCADCDCKGSKWGEKTITINNTTKPLVCDKNKINDVKCKVPITINANYICAQTNCQGTVSYALTTPANTTTTGTVPLTFTPNTSGIYTVVLYGMCGGTICDSCVIRFRTECPVDTSCCPYNISITPKDQSSTVNNAGNATVVTNNFIINGLGLANLTEVRAEVQSYTITDNYNKECMKCVNLPFTWASVSSANPINAIIPQVTMYGGTTVPVFNGTGTGVYQNPREITWNNGSTFSIPNNTSVGINFILPPPPAIDCCEFKAKICVKFTFRDNQCKECEAIACFEVQIKKK